MTLIMLILIDTTLLPESRYKRLKESKHLNEAIYYATSLYRLGLIQK